MWEVAGRRSKAEKPSWHWNTSPEHAEAARQALGGVIHLDPCSNKWSFVGAKVEYFGPPTGQNGLLESWDFPTIFVNPPYGSVGLFGSMRSWLRCCADAHRTHGAEVIALIPVAPNTRHWKDSVFGVARGICFVAAPRVKFYFKGEIQKKGAPMAIAAVYWGTNYVQFRAAYAALGNSVKLEPVPQKPEPASIMDLLSE